MLCLLTQFSVKVLTVTSTKILYFRRVYNLWTKTTRTRMCQWIFPLYSVQGMCSKWSIMWFTRWLWWQFGRRSYGMWIDQTGKEFCTTFCFAFITNKKRCKILMGQFLIFSWFFGWFLFLISPISYGRRFLNSSCIFLKSTSSSLLGKADKKLDIST